MRTESFGPWATALSPVRGAKLSTFWARRLTMLTNLGRSSPILSRRVRYGLIAMAMVALVMPSLRGTPAALPGGDENDHPRSQTAAAPKGNDQALDDFLQIYRLAPGQDLKRIEPPRPAGVNAWWKHKFPNRANRPGQFGSMMVFRWRDPDHLEDGGMGGPGTICTRS